MKDNELLISLKLEKQSTIDLFKLTNAINSLNYGLSDCVYKNTGAKISLELKDVKSGSDIFNFLVVIPATLVSTSEFIGAINAFFELFNNLKNIKNQSVEDIEKNQNYTKENIKDFSNIVEISNNANVTINNNFNTYKVYMQEGGKEYKEGIGVIKKIKGFDSKKPIKRIYENMMIEFYQTTNTDKPLKHKVYCYELDANAIATIIDDERLKKEMLENPYSYRFLVDLEVYKDTQGYIKNYRAFNYKDKVEIS